MANNQIISAEKLPIPSDIGNTLKNIKNPKAFGDQLPKPSADKIKKIVLREEDKLRIEIQKVIKEKLELDIKHQAKLQSLETRLKAKSLTQEEYDDAVFLENANYKISKEILQRKQDDLEKALNDIKKDPYKKEKEKEKKRKKRTKDKQSAAKKEDQAANKARKQAIFKAVKKTITPILILALTDQLIKVVGQLNRLQKIVNKTNEIIKAANTPEKINQARIARDNALKEINKVQTDLLKISQQIQKLQTYITIFNLVVTIISALPIPTSVPPGIGIPLNIITKLQQTLQKATNIVFSLSYILGISVPLLQRIINKLEDLKKQLLQISESIDVKTALTLPQDQFSALLNLIGTQETREFPSYKGFKFAIKEEQNPQFVVKGNKRRYAVAIDTSDIEVLKSENSFTLDPQVLIDQLKLIIDERNLEA